MSIGASCSSAAASLRWTLSHDASSNDDNDHINLRMEGDDPYIGFKEFPPLDLEEIEGVEEVEEVEIVEVEEEVAECEDETMAEGSSVLDKLKPCIGMEFGTDEEAYNFYNSYAGAIGFSVRKNHRGKSRNGISSCRFVCNKQGLSKRQKEESEGSLNCGTYEKSPQRDRGTTRTSCMASLSIRLVEGGVWKVTVFNEDHNHELLKSPAKKRNLRSQRHMDQEVDEIIEGLSAQNIRTSKIYEYIGAKRGGKRRLHFKKQDVSNKICKHNRKIIGRDVETTVAYFVKKQQEDPEFFYAIDPDDEGHARHIFWVDGRARRAYLEFGDVVTFDTTYNTNRYSMPLAPFIGVNHHRRSIFFGMALIRNEKEVNFIWLFETWLKAMYEKHPKSILTDQDPAMKAAIKVVFPNTTHRCCQWHVMRKAREKFMKLYHTKPGLEDELKAVINRSLTVAEFDEAWGKMLKNNNLENEGHWKVMYGKRDEWVPAFFRDKFFADMSTTQRSESMNAILKMWLDNHTSIYQFVQRIEAMIEGVWNQESDDDIKDINVMPRMWSKLSIEYEARINYTWKNFAIFKEILKESFVGIVIEHERDKRYEVSIKMNLLVGIWRSESFMIDVDKENETFSCNCKGFEFEGLLCQHAIKVMLHVGLEQLPKGYILQRWCKGANINAKRPVEERCRDLEYKSEALLSFRKAKLFVKYKKIEELFTDETNDFEMVLSKFEELQIELASRKQMKQIEVTEKAAPATTIEESDKIASPETYLDPPMSQCKGRPKRPGRMKPTFELIGKQGRICSYCHNKDTHNISTCPKRLNDIAKEKTDLAAT